MSFKIEQNKDAWKCLKLKKILT